MLIANLIFDLELCAPQRSNGPSAERGNDRFIRGGQGNAPVQENVPHPWKK